MKPPLKRFVAKVAERAGYTIVPNWKIDTFAQTRYLERLFNLLQMELVLDVGANAGRYPDLLRDQVGYSGEIVSFEPDPHLGRNLAERAVKDANWHIETFALGQEEGESNLNIMANNLFSSFLEPRHDEVRMFQDLNHPIEKIRVRVTTLDTIFPSLVDRFRPRASYLKLDTQGFDLQVLRGGLKSLSHIAALQTEASVRPIYVNAPKYNEVIAFCEERRFVMSGIFPNNPGHFPQLIEFDCHMVRRELAESLAA